MSYTDSDRLLTVPGLPRGAQGIGDSQERGLEAMREFRMLDRQGAFRTACSGLLVLAAMSAASARAQTTLADWDFTNVTNPASPGNPVTVGIGAAVAPATEVSLMPGLASTAITSESIHTGVCPSLQGLQYSGGNWVASGEANLQKWDGGSDGCGSDSDGVNDNYLAFTLTAAGPTIDLNRITLSAWRNGGGAPSHFALQVCIDGSLPVQFGTPIEVSGSGGPSAPFEFLATLTGATSVEVRFVPADGSSSTAGTGNIHIDGWKVEQAALNPPPPPVGQPPDPVDATNVLFLIADDLSKHALACYGNPVVQTPHLDSLASRGMLFERAYCQYPVCGTSRTSMMSGVYPGGSVSGLPHWPVHFRNNGYEARRVSKIYHMRVPGDITSGNDGGGNGSWTSWFNVVAPEWQTPGTGFFTHGTGNFSQPTTHYSLGFGTAFYCLETSTSGAEQADYLAVDEAINLLDQAAVTGNPFVLAVGFVRPHVPLVAPSADFDLYDPLTIPLAASVPNDRADIPSEGISWSGGPYGDADSRLTLQAYYASVSFLDAQVGRLLARLDALGLADDTVVVFTSDHGYHLGEHGQWQKLSIHEESASVPLILAGPGVQAGRTGALAELVDVYPTLAELTDLPVPTQCQGLSLKPVLADASARVRTAAYSKVNNGNGRMLRSERWAYLRYGSGAEELYDMELDPKQFTNLASDPAYAALKQAFSIQLDEKMAAMSGALGTPFCAGDGSEADCPCGNESTTSSGHGCTNVAGTGAYITASGSPSMGSDSLKLSVHQAVPNDFGVFVHNITTQVGQPFYNGSFCLTPDAHLVRHMDFSLPVMPLLTDGTGFARSAYVVSTLDFVGDLAPGVAMHCQFWGRDNLGPCGTGANFSSGLSITWLP